MVESSTAGPVSNNSKEYLTLLAEFAVTKGGVVTCVILCVGRNGTAVTGGEADGGEGDFGEGDSGEGDGGKEDGGEGREKPLASLAAVELALTNSKRYRKMLNILVTLRLRSLCGNIQVLTASHGI